MLTGEGLLSKVKELGDASKSDLVRACGYSDTQEGGSEHLNFIAFYEALLEAQGIDLVCEVDDKLEEHNHLPSNDEVYIVLESHCSGAYPIDGLEEVTNENLFSELVNSILDYNLHCAKDIALSNLSAEFCTGAIRKFHSSGIKYVSTLSVDIEDPFVDHDSEVIVPLFRWISARFLVSIPKVTLDEWLDFLEDGATFYNEDKFRNWLGTENSLQDGCTYFLGVCLYELTNVGEHSCVIDAGSVNAIFNQPPSGRLYGSRLREVIGQQSWSRASEELILSCGYVLPDGKPNYFAFREAASDADAEALEAELNSYDLESTES